MASTTQLDRQQRVDTLISEKFCIPTRAAVKKFGQVALEQQRDSIKNAALKCLEDDGWIFLQKNPLKKVSEGARVPYATCASPFCPAFNRLFQPGEHRISIEPFSNMLMKYVPSHPLADLATTCASPISGEGNVRGKGEYNCLWMHVNCAEYLGIGLLAHTDRIRIERRLSTFPGVEYKLDSPETYSVLKWIAVHTGDKSQAGLEGRDFWRKDDGLAVYLSRRQFDYVGRWKRGRIEIAAKEARDMLLSSVLAYTAVLKERAPKLKDKPDKPDRMASLPQAAKAFEQRTASRLEEVEELEAEKGMIEDEQERKEYEADVDEPGHLEAEWATVRHDGLTQRDLKEIRKKAMRWHFSRPNRNGWDEYLIQQRSAALRATEPEDDSVEASMSEGSPMETSPSEAEESSSESIPLVTPMVRFLVSDSEDVSPRSPDSPMQEAPFQVDNASSQEGESLDSWSDPDETIATLGENVGLAERIF